MSEENKRAALAVTLAERLYKEFEEYKENLSSFCMDELFERVPEMMVTQAVYRFLLDWYCPSAMLQHEYPLEISMQAMKEWFPDFERFAPEIDDLYSALRGYEESRKG